MVVLWVWWSQFTLPKTFVHSTETNPCSTCLITPVTATEEPGSYWQNDLVLNHDSTPATHWGSVCSFPCCYIPPMGSQESPWAAPSDQHSHASQMSPGHCADNVVLVCGPMQKPEITDLQNSGFISPLCTTCCWVLLAWCNELLACLEARNQYREVFLICAEELGLRWCWVLGSAGSENWIASVSMRGSGHIFICCVGSQGI